MMGARLISSGPIALLTLLAMLSTASTANAQQSVTDGELLVCAMPFADLSTRRWDLASYPRDEYRCRACAPLLIKLGCIVNRERCATMDIEGLRDCAKRLCKDGTANPEACKAWQGGASVDVSDVGLDIYHKLLGFTPEGGLKPELILQSALARANPRDGMRHRATLLPHLRLTFYVNAVALGTASLLATMLFNQPSRIGGRARRR